jgi:hypothetical protein
MEELGEVSQMLGRNGLVVERPYRFTGGSTQAGAKVGFTEQTRQSCGEGRGIPRGHEQGVLLRDHLVGKAGQIGGHHRPTGGHRFQDCHGMGFAFVGFGRIAKYIQFTLGLGEGHRIK